jgi:predicted house-cleaning noncanonical NTP pyrophosphatase (MazG superfamily)
MNKTINDMVREVVEGEGESAKEFEISLDFHASFTIKAKSKEEAIEIAMDKARLEYGPEVADYGDFIVREGA